MAGEYTSIEPSSSLLDRIGSTYFVTHLLLFSKLYLCGLSNRAKKGLSLTGVKPEPGFLDQRSVRFFTNLDTVRAQLLFSKQSQSSQ